MQRAAPGRARRRLSFGAAVCIPRLPSGFHSIPQPAPRDAPRRAAAARRPRPPARRPARPRAAAAPHHCYPPANEATRPRRAPSNAVPPLPTTAGAPPRAPPHLQEPSPLVCASALTRKRRPRWHRRRRRLAGGCNSPAAPAHGRPLSGRFPFFSARHGPAAPRPRGPSRPFLRCPTHAAPRPLPGAPACDPHACTAPRPAGGCSRRCCTRLTNTPHPWPRPCAPRPSLHPLSTRPSRQARGGALPAAAAGLGRGRAEPSLAPPRCCGDWRPPGLAGCAAFGIPLGLYLVSHARCRITRPGARAQHMQFGAPSSPRRATARAQPAGRIRNHGARARVSRPAPAARRRSRVYVFAPARGAARPFGAPLAWGAPPAARLALSAPACVTDVAQHSPHRPLPAHEAELGPASSPISRGALSREMSCANCVTNKVCIYTRQGIHVHTWRQTGGWG